MRQVTADDPARGILDFPHALERFRLQRYAAAPHLRAWVEGYWVVAWSLAPGEEHEQTNLSHASLNAAWEPDGSFLYGVPRRTFVRRITGSGYVFGTKFRPGGFYPFSPVPLAPLTGNRVDLQGIFGARAREWDRRMREAASEKQRVRLTDDLWTSLQERDRDRFGTGPSVATRMAERLTTDRTILGVAQAAAACEVPVRALQRRFVREVGIGPKEVIRRFRLQEAAERLLRQPWTASGDIALDLGYFDQAHFVRDFKTVVGVPPEVYRRRQGLPRRKA